MFQAYSIKKSDKIGEWKKTDDNTIECTVTRPANVIYMFATD